MRRQKSLNICALVIVALYLCNYFLFLIFNPNSIIITQWFSIYMIFMAIYLYCKAILFKSDSNFYLANTLLGSAVLMIIQYLEKIPFLKMLPFYILVATIPYLLNVWIFGSKYQIKLFFVNFLLFLVSFIIIFLLIF